MSHSIDEILRDWPYDPDEVHVRLLTAADGREVLQMRLDMGLLQLETTGRPDGEHPGGAETYFDFLLAKASHAGDGFTLSEEQCNEIDREFVQFYHRRICWLALKNYHQAVSDADHSLELMDFCKEHSPEESWTLSHEQYRPFVLFHRTQAASLAAVEDEQQEAAVQEINAGLERMLAVFREYEAEDRFEEDELVKRLIELREALRERFNVGRTLEEQLDDAVAAEKYELAAELRDQLRRRSGQH